MTLSSWMHLVGWFAAETATLMVAAAILHACLRSPRTRRIVWQAAFVAVALVGIIELSGLRGKLPGPGFKQHHRFVVAATVFPVAGKEAGTDERAAAVTPAAASLPGVVKWPGWVWLAGVALLLARTFVARVCLGLHRRAASPADGDSLRMIGQLQASLGLRRVQAQVWTGLRSPVAFGILRPAIALPPDFSARFSFDQRHAMLAHEMAHLAARDPFWLTLSDTVIALAWWHPLVWWARHKLEIVTEAAADEASALVPGGPCALAECLVRLGREITASNPARALGIGGNGPQSRLAGRIERLLREPQAWRQSSAWTRWTAHLAAVFVASTSVVLPIQTGVSGSILAMLATAAPSRADERPPAVAASLTPVSGPATRKIAAPGGATNQSPTILLSIEPVLMEERDSDDIGLDWIFGLTPSNNPALETNHDWKVLQASGAVPLQKNLSINPKNLIIDRLRTDGQSVILTQEQFAALRARIVSPGQHEKIKPSSRDGIKKNELTDMPLKCITHSSAQTRIAMQDLITCVTGVEGTLDTKGASIHFSTDDFRLGPSFDIFPELEGQDRCRLRVHAGLTTFFGYDKVADTKFTNGVPSAKTPLPHFRVIEADAEGTVPLGQTLAIRGPLWSDTTKTKTHFFTPAQTKTIRSRLYVFVTPTHPPPDAK